MDPAGKTMLITGASSGIGKETALALAPRGARLALTYYRNREALEEVNAACREGGRRGARVGLV